MGMTTGRVLLAGGSGALGGAVAKRLSQGGAPLRILSRRERPGPARGGEAEWFRGDALDPASLAGACDGVDAVFSALGAPVDPNSRSKAPYSKVDGPANRNLIEAAKRAGVRRFVYVSVFHAPSMRDSAYVKAHEDVVAALKASGLSYGVVRPTGFFSALAGLLPMAKKGRLPLFGSGAAKSNPIHEDDLAEVCVAAIRSSEPALEIDAGGPDVLSRAEMNRLAFEALGLPDASLRLPPFVATLAAPLARLVNPRMGELMEFLGSLSKHDAVAPVRGQKRLADYFAESAALTR